MSDNTPTPPHQPAGTPPSGAVGKEDWILQQLNNQSGDSGDIKAMERTLEHMNDSLKELSGDVKELAKGLQRIDLVHVRVLSRCAGCRSIHPGVQIRSNHGSAFEIA